MPCSLEYHLGTYTKEPISPIVRLIKDNFKKGDIIVHTSPNLDLPFWFYWGDDYKFYYFVIPGALDKMYKEVILKSRWSEYHVYDLSTNEELPFRRVWLICSSWARDGRLYPNSIAVMEWMDKKYKRVYKKEFYEIGRAHV